MRGGKEPELWLLPQSVYPGATASVFRSTQIKGKLHGKSNLKWGEGD